MPDQTQIPNTNSVISQNLHPVIPSDPPAPSVLSGGTPPPALVEPVPLPKATDIEPPQESPSPPSEPPPPSPAESPHPLFEKPVTVAPVKKPADVSQPGQPKIPKAVIAGIAALVFLIVGLGSGLYLVRQRGIGEIRKLATSGCQLVGSGSDRGCWCASGGWQFHCGSDEAGCRTECDSRNKGGPQPTNPPPPAGCQPYDGPDCGGDSQGFCTRCPDGAGGKTEYFCKSPNVGVGGGCRAPGGGGVNECNRNEDCPSGQVCQGIEGSKRCQQQTGGGGTCGNNFIAFRCRLLTNGECRENPADFTDESAARMYANAWGCGQVDQVWSLSGDRTLCGGFSIFSEGCEGVRPTEPPGPQATSTPAPPGEQPSPTPTPVTISANCVSLVAQMSDGSGGWVTKTDSEFAATARPGDRVRFMCTGAKTRGNFTKSAFFINNILHIDDVVKLNDTQFAVEYTIPVAGALTVESVLLHDSKGWVD